MYLPGGDLSFGYHILSPSDGATTSVVDQITGYEEKYRHTEGREIKVKIDPAFGEKTGQRML